MVTRILLVIRTYKVFNIDSEPQIEPQIQSWADKGYRVENMFSTWAPYPSGKGSQRWTVVMVKEEAEELVEVFQPDLCDAQHPALSSGCDLQEGHEGEHRAPYAEGGGYRMWSEMVEAPDVSD